MSNFNFVSSDGHFIDDPLYVVNSPLDFSDLGMQPVFSNSDTSFTTVL